MKKTTNYVGLLSRKMNQFILEPINLRDYYNGEVVPQIVTLDMLYNQWKNITITEKDYTIQVYEENFQVKINQFSTSLKDELVACIFFFSDIMRNQHREYLNWFIRTDIPVIRFLIYSMVFSETIIDTTNAVLLASLIDLQWIPEIDYVLSLNLLKVKELMCVIYMSANKNNELLFERMINTRFLHTTTPLLKKACYHIFCFIGRYDLWKNLFEYRENDWWTIEECIAEMDNSFSRFESEIPISRYFKCEDYTCTSWDVYEHFSECAGKELTQKLLIQRFDFKIQCSAFNDCMNIAIQTALDPYLSYDEISVINEFYWGKSYKIPELTQGCLRVSRDNINTNNTTNTTNLSELLSYDEETVYNISPLFNPFKKRKLNQ